MKRQHWILVIVLALGNIGQGIAAFRQMHFVNEMHKALNTDTGNLELARIYILDLQAQVAADEYENGELLKLQRHCLYKDAALEPGMDYR